MLFIGLYAAYYYTRDYPEPNEPESDIPEMPEVFFPEATPSLSMLPQTKNFSLAEFACKDGTAVPTEYYGNVQRLMNNLQVLRDEIGLPIIVNSGYRTKKYNAKVKGKPKSSHIVARAADIKVIGMSAARVHQKIEQLIAEGKMEEGGLGSYGTFTHYDVRGYRSRWHG